jgi:hypothetical protein
MAMAPVFKEFKGGGVLMEEKRWGIDGGDEGRALDALDGGLKGEEGAEGGERPAAALLLGNRGEVGRLEEEEGADRWAPPVGDRVRERGGKWAHVGRRGPKAGGAGEIGPG